MEAFRALSGPSGYSRAIHPEEVNSTDWWIAERDWLPLVDVGSDVQLNRWLTVDSVEQIAAFCRERIDGFYRSAARDEAKDDVSFFAERSVSPRLSAMVRELFPHMAELHLMRDPRDILASRLSFIKRTGVQQFGRDAAPDDEQYVRRHFAFEMRHFLQKWEESGDRALLVKYEDLIQKPRDALSRVFGHIGVDAGSKVVAQVLEQARRRTPDRQARHITAPDQSGSIGRWRRDLSPALLTACDEALGETIGRLDYA
jgi:hypothetical protein